MLKKIFIKIIAFSAIIMLLTYLASLFITFNVVNTLLGMIVGIFLSITRVYMLNMSINQVVDMDPKSARKMATFNYIIRYLLTAAVLVGLVFYSVESLFGAAIIIILATKFSIYTTKIKDGDFTKLVDIDEERKKEAENNKDEKDENEKQDMKEDNAEK